MHSQNALIPSSATETMTAKAENESSSETAKSEQVNNTRMQQQYIAEFILNDMQTEAETGRATGADNVIEINGIIDNKFNLDYKSFCTTNHLTDFQSQPTARV